MHVGSGYMSTRTGYAMGIRFYFVECMYHKGLVEMLIYLNFVSGSKEADAPRKLSGVNKRCWRYVPGLSKPAGIKAIETIQTKAKKTKTKPAETETVEKAQEAEPQAA